MSKHITITTMTFLACSLAFAGCLGGVGVDAGLSTVELAQDWDNGMGWNGDWDNGMGWNGEWNNGETWNGDWQNGITSGALTSDSLAGTDIADLLDDPAAHSHFEYLISCALDADQSTEIETGDGTEVFSGAIGLAPEWGEPGGTCDDECQGWVSACLISRVNAHGEHILISMRGEHDALATDEEEEETFEVEEATYFGNLFAEPLQIHACLPDGADRIPRVCGDSLDDCFVQVAGECEDVCDDGVCADAGGNEYTESITVFLDDDTVEHYYDED